jgi:hypothetical protein
MFLLDEDSREVEGIPSDAVNERAMMMGSLHLLRAVEKAQGKFKTPRERKPAPYVPVAQRFMAIPYEARGHEIIRRAAFACGMSYDEVVGRRRSRPYVLARIIAAKLLREQTYTSGAVRYSLPQIGKMLGGRDHSSICYLLSMFEPYCRMHDGMRDAYEKANGGSIGFGDGAE